MNAQPLELADVQGLVVRGYGTLPLARYLLGAVEDPAGARAWLGTLAERLDDARERPERTAVNLALTASGLTALGLPQAALAGFGQPFADGMTAEHRARLLGDEGGDAPERWDWGRPDGEPVHVLLLLYAADDAALDALEAQLTVPAVRIVTRLDTAPMQPREHFGFRDGVSQPRIAGLGDAADQHTVAPGEFVLGYGNEYGLAATSPVVAARDDPAGILPPAPGDGADHDLGRNGSFLVLRTLSQDVHAFWSFCERATARDDGSPDEAARLRLAAKLVGRWPSGAPLALAPDADDPALGERNDFAYAGDDAHGLRCPVGAHVRRANPRDSLDPHPGSAQSVAVGKRHRLLRRGRQYGRFLPTEELLSSGVDDAWREEPRGLHFICLAANLARQFEFVQHTWVNNPRFGVLYDAPDPLIGATPGGERTFTVPARPVRERHTGVPRFVGVRGGAYFFLPGLRAVRYLAALGG
jgi:Dyp-type peroxidase family